jgi:RimJ/RimL family protein N-acetyltransferase
MEMQTIIPTGTELELQPATVAHVTDMFAVLSDPQIYRYLDDEPPPSVEHLRSVYQRREKRQSPDGSEQWLNWVVWPGGSKPVGVVQATIISSGAAWIAYVFGSQHWGKGYAHAATSAMMDHLVKVYGVTGFMATVETENARSIRLLERLSFRLATAQEARCRDLSATELLYVRE